MSSAVYSQFDLVRGRRPPHAKVREMAIEEYKRRHKGHMDHRTLDAIDNAVEGSFRDDMLGQFTNVHAAFEDDTPYTRNLSQYYGVPVSKRPTPIKGILSGSASGTAETERRWAMSVVNIVERSLMPMDESIFEKRYQDEPWMRQSALEIAIGNASKEGVPSGMQETDVDPGKTGHFNTFYHRALPTHRSRHDHRERELPSRVTHDMTTKVLEPGNVSSSLFLDPLTAFDD